MKPPSRRLFFAQALDQSVDIALRFFPGQPRSAMKPNPLDDKTFSRLVFKVNPSSPFILREDGLWLCEKESDEAHRVHPLSPDGVAVIKLCDGKRTAGEIRDLLPAGTRPPQEFYFQLVRKDYLVPVR